MLEERFFMRKFVHKYGVSNIVKPQKAGPNRSALQTPVGACFFYCI